MEKYQFLKIRIVPIFSDWIGLFICLPLLVSRLLDSLDRFQTIDRLLLTRRLILLS